MFKTIGRQDEREGKGEIRHKPDGRESGLVMNATARIMTSANASALSDDGNLANALTTEEEATG
jgi:hypothetical protein